MSPSSRLFEPLSVTPSLNLAHRVVLAPLTRYRANSAHVHESAAVEYYGQRTSTKGTLAITEATFIAEEAGGDPNIPGIWSKDQIAAWKKVTDRVHSNGSYIFLQLWALGRVAQVKILEEEGPHPLVSAGDIPAEEGASKPRPLTKEEIKKYVGLYRQAALNAVEAGFDGVEIHGANGYLVDQFFQSVSNNRTDEYGGSVENRARFGLEILDAVTEAIGEDKTAIRFSPFSTFQGMREPDPFPTFTYAVSAIRKSHPNLAYIHLVEPRISGNADTDHPSDDSLLPFFKLWTEGRKAGETGGVFLVAGGYNAERATHAVDDIYTGENAKVAVAIGRHFLANPDLPLRIKHKVPFTRYNRDTFYLFGPDKTEGYLDYPFAPELTGQKL